MRIINPATEELIRELEDDAEEIIADKLKRARAGQKAWARTPLEERITRLRRFRELVVERTEQLARTTTLEMGKPISQSRNELKALLGRIDFFVDQVGRELEDEVVSRSGELEERIRHEPLGVVANVSAWNYPYFVGANVFVPALLTGNSVLYKPSEYATLTGLELARALWDAGVPEDVFVPVVGGGATGAQLVELPIDAVFFTGSYATGKRIAERVAPRMIKLQLELGGKDPLYVTEDVELGAAAASAADGAFYNTGQSCCAVERVYVHEAIYKPFVEQFVAATKSFALGDPSEESTYIGPLARRDAALGVLEQQVGDARKKGATLLSGGRRAERTGWFFEPTVLGDVTHEMAVMREESFGPVIGLMQVANDDEALTLMADTEYGLTAAVYGRDRARAERLLGRLDVGTAYWNCCDRVSPRLPWTGRRHSGIGCTLSTYGIEAFLHPKAWHLRHT
jgi:acyl-CoA reductase-like NAD-dependent aldehyde dehydrogenase